LRELQRRLKEKQAACEQMREDIIAVRAEQEKAKSACMAGVNAAKVQMARMSAELKALTSCTQAFNLDEVASAVEDDELAGTALPSEASARSRPQQSEEERARLEALRLRARQLRHELSKWRHQAESLESASHSQEEEIVYLKAQLTHARDVLDSTRYAVRHHEVERKLREAALLPLPDGAGNPDLRTDLRLWQGENFHKLTTRLPDKMTLEAKCERRIRERTEERAGVLTTKAQRLMSVVSSQQLLIQRLERQLLQEEDQLEQREGQLAGVARQRARLKGALRQRSDDVVAAAVGVPGMRKQSSSVPPGRCSDNGMGGAGGIAKSSSVALLPLIEERH